MKQPLWIINISLLAIMLVALMMNFFLKQQYQPFKARIVSREEPQARPEELPSIKIDQIYKNDLFDTYTPPPEEVPPTVIPPLPSPKPPKITPPPEPPKIEMLPPLSITIKGIIFSANNTKSYALVEDETGKEKSYTEGEKIKDAQLIKIAKNHLVLLRTNGQQDTLFLRKEDSERAKQKVGWEAVVKKINDTTYHVDLEKFKMEVPTLAALLEKLSLTTAYQNENPVGLRVGEESNQELGKALGLQNNDIIIRINTKEVATIDGRIKAFEEIGKLTWNDSVDLSIKRNGNELSITYKLLKIKAPQIPPFGTGPQPEDKVIKEGLFKLSREQERMKRKRRFETEHLKHKETTTDIQKQLFENMKRRQFNARER